MSEARGLSVGGASTPGHPAIGVDIGGTKILAALVDPDGAVRADATAATPVESAVGRGSDGDRVAVGGPPGTGGVAVGRPHAIVAGVVAAVRGLLADCGLDTTQIRGIGVGTAGTVDDQGVIVAATNILPGWRGVRLRDELVSAFGCPVAVVNDVHAIAQGEAWTGAARAIDRAVVVALGTGIGGALIEDGRVWPGPGGTAGSVGHLPAPGPVRRRCSCGQVGHLEPLASGPGIEETYRKVTGEAFGLRRIGELARAGDAVAVSVITEAATALGQVLAGVTNLYAPQAILLGGGVLGLGDLILQPTRMALRAHVMAGLEETPVLAAMLGPKAGAIGAAALIPD